MSSVDVSSEAVQSGPAARTVEMQLEVVNLPVADVDRAKLMLIVSDIEEARADLIARGVEASEVFHDKSGVFHHAGTECRVPGPDPKGRSYSTWVSFSDPDGNGWLLQEIKTRLPGRV